MLRAESRTGIGVLCCFVLIAVATTVAMAATEVDESKELDKIDWAKEVETRDKIWDVLYALVPEPPKPGAVFYLVGQMPGGEHTQFAAYLKPQVERTSKEIEAKFGKPDAIEPKGDRLFRSITGERLGGMPITRSVQGEYRRYGMISFMSQAGTIRYIWAFGTNVHDRIQMPRGKQKKEVGKKPVALSTDAGRKPGPPVQAASPAPPRSAKRP